MGILPSRGGGEAVYLTLDGGDGLGGGDDAGVAVFESFEGGVVEVLGDGGAAVID